MTKTTGQRTNSARGRSLAADLRKLYQPRLDAPESLERPSIRVRHRPTGLQWWGSVELQGQASRYFRLEVDADASDALVIAAWFRAEEADWAARQSKRLRLGGSTSTSRVWLAKALEQLRQRQVTAKTEATLTRWLRLIVGELEAAGQPLTPEAVLAVIRARTERTNRNRRTAIEAGRLLLQANTSRTLTVPPSDTYVPPKPKARPSSDPAQVIEGLQLLWEAEGETAQAAAWLTTMVALTGARGALLLGSEFAWPELWGTPRPGLPPLELQHGAVARAFDGKARRKRSAHAVISSREILEAIGAERLAQVPVRILEARLPWDGPATDEQQRRAELLAGGVREQVTRRVPQYAEALAFRQLRHDATERLMRNGKLTSAQVAEILSTSPAQIEARYGSGHKFAGLLQVADL